MARNFVNPPVRRGWWLTPRGELYETEEHGHKAFVYEHPELFGHKYIDRAIDDGNIRIINDTGMATSSFHKGAIPVSFWEAEISTKRLIGKRWMERLNVALRELGVRPGTVLPVFDWHTDKTYIMETSSMVINPPSRRGWWLTSRDELYEVDLDADGYGHVSFVYEHLGKFGLTKERVEKEEFSTDWMIENIMVRGAIRIIHDNTDGGGWGAEVSTHSLRGRKWPERINMVMRELEVPHGTVIDIYEWVSSAHHRFVTQMETS